MSCHLPSSQLYTCFYLRLSYRNFVDSTLGIIEELSFNKKVNLQFTASGLQRPFPTSSDYFRFSVLSHAFQNKII